MCRRTVAIALVAVAWAAPAAAQPVWHDRGHLTVNGDFQLATRFSGVAHPVNFVEPATIDTDYKLKSAPGLDVGTVVRVWRNLGVGADVSYFTKSSGASISAQMPHPFFFGRARAVSGDATGLQHAETAVHVHAMWMLPVSASAPWEVGVFGGPSLVSVRQELVNDVTVTETYPFDTAAYAGTVSERRSKSRIGFNVGADVIYLLGRRYGIGFATSFSRARVPLASSAGETVKVDAGGARVGAGLRVRF